jgi:hypothetical protein
MCPSLEDALQEQAWNLNVNLVLSCSRLSAAATSGATGAGAGSAYNGQTPDVRGAGKGPNHASCWVPPTRGLAAGAHWQARAARCWVGWRPAAEPAARGGSTQLWRFAR